MNAEPQEAWRNEIGRRLYAAIISCQMRLKSVDYALKNYTPQLVDPAWGELGEKLQRQLQEAVSERLRRNTSKIHLVVDNTELPF
jgi:anti-anti-sigma regulatory factor